MFRLFASSAKLLTALTIGSALWAAVPVSGFAQTHEEREQRRAQRMEQRAAQQQERVIQRGPYAAPASTVQPHYVPPIPVYVPPQQGQVPRQQYVAPVAPVAPSAPIAPPAVVPIAPPQAVPSGRLSPEERRELRRQIREHGRDLYGERRR